MHAEIIVSSDVARELLSALFFFDRVTGARFLDRRPIPRRHSRRARRENRSYDWPTVPSSNLSILPRAAAMLPPITRIIGSNESVYITCVVDV